MVGDRDMDLIEMELYDNYRRSDGEPYPTEYLLKCRKKLKTKLHKCSEKINPLELKISKINLEHKQERERLRKYYETIAFGQSRTGLMVRSAMGTSSAAEKIMN